MTTQELNNHVVPLQRDDSQKFSWREYFILTIAGVFGTIASLPTMFSTIEQTAVQANIPVQLLLGEQIVQSAIFMLIAVGVGLLLAGKTGLGAPILRSRLNGEAVSGKLRAIIFPSISLAILTSLTVIALDKWVFSPRMPGFSSVITQVSGWQGFLASFYGGIVEEILSRLFLLTLIAWLLSWISHTSDGRPTKTAMWIAIIGSALVFGLGHLPATLATNQLSGIVIARALLLNGIAGTTFGYLYWKRGLESSMIGHFSADLLVHFILPFFPV